MLTTTRTTFALLCLLLPTVALSQAAPEKNTTADDLGFYLSTRIDALDFQSSPAVANEPIRAHESLTRLYDSIGRSPLWLHRNQPTLAARGAADHLARAFEQGLDPEDYHAAAIQGLIRQVEAVSREQTSNQAGDPLPSQERDRLFDLELLLSDGLLHYGAHLLSGRIKSGVFDPDLNRFRHEIDLVPQLVKAATGSPDRFVAQLEPATAAYRHLKRALLRYREIEQQGGFVDIPPGPVLAEGTRSTPVRIEALRRRLEQSGDHGSTREAPPSASPPSRSMPAEIYDAELSQAVRRFQTRQGLTADGKLGPATATALAVPVGERIAAIELSMERLRWLPRDLGRRHLLVNIPESRLQLIDDDRTTLDMRVIVGRPDRPTAVFSDAVRYLVFYPYWEVPLTLAVEDELPKIQEDPSWVHKRNFEVLKGWDDNARALDPESIDWNSVGPDEFPYRLRQRPGPGNALGRIKFMFPNGFSIYLHDTPTRKLFQQEKRSLSSGCIRLESPVELAGELLEGTPLWDRWRIDQVLEAGRQTTVPLLSPVPIHLVYFTAWPDELGEVGFHDDIYRLDPGLRTDLDR